MSQAVLNRAMTEDELLKAVTEALTLYGWTWTHSRRSDRAITMGHRGLPDVVAVKDGRGVVFVELKTEKGRTTPEQDHWLYLLRRVGVGAWVVRPSTLDFFLSAIAR